MPSNLYLRNTWGPLLLISLCPPLVIIFWYTFVFLDGSLFNLVNAISQEGFFPFLKRIWAPVFFGSKISWTLLASFAAIQLIFMRFLPGKIFKGPLTPQGNVPLYKANGILAYGLTLTLWVLGAYIFKIFSPTIIYDHFGEILGSLNIFSLLFCLLLLLKGLFFPSSQDKSVSGNFIFDYYWGIELYPRIFGLDIKMFTNCRFALMSWPLIILSFAAKQNELYSLSDSMLVAVGLQLLYITKFFMWETGYLSSLDIMHDHAGFYICWGCLVWVPGIYTSSTLYLVNHPNQLGLLLSLLIFLLGSLCILSNYLADRQRQKVRLSQGECKVWGKKPTLITAQFITRQGEKKTNLLLASGWWGIARHFHYVPEILGAFFWSLPALFLTPLPYFYVIFLTILLLDRAYRDDARCVLKYGKDWEKYCERVPYKVIPYLL